MRGSVIRRWGAAGAALVLSLSLTACQGETMTAFDATAYVQGVLDETYKGTWDNAFLDLVDLTDGEAQDAYEASLNEEYRRFAYQFDLNDSLLTEETRQSALDLLAEVSAKAQYTVQQTVALDDTRYAVEVSVRPIEPQGKLIGFASVNIGGIVIDDFKVVNGKNGIFLGEPSKPDPTTRTGYRSTARVTNRALQERLSAAAADGYNMAVEKLIARAEALRPKPIREQMANAAKEAAKENATRPAPAKGKEARDDR